MSEPYFNSELVALLLPDAMLTRFNLARPFRFGTTREEVFALHHSEGHPGLRLEVWPDPECPDPGYVLELKFNFLGIPEIAWIAANDLAAPRFNVDALGRLPLEPKSGLRNVAEEVRAMEWGLAPNQVRSGLHILRESLGAVENYLAALGVNIVTLSAMAYHNAVEYRHLGFMLKSGEELMIGIEEGFAPGGRLSRLLDGSTPFRKPENARTLLGRSWAIHDGLMGDEWYAPELIRVIP